MPCFDDRAPSTRLLIEAHPQPGEILHTMDVSLPEHWHIANPTVWVRTNRQTEAIVCGVSWTRLDTEDGA